MADTPPFNTHPSAQKQLRVVRFVKPKYSAETKINVTGIYRKWTRYCNDNRIGDWKKTIQNLARETTMDFFLPLRLRKL
ncbi:hypothetical protein G6O67_007116 [Ophiocordyceps sinensis]|uniref:Uncharacterized protein n=1 Tax=Ophiocordyceps sinensis TaxID=72228 RepID=A0A8H4PNM1_9HYPO|nr:hypothetical protein G6O67_007116 [Ophiocordyceps sinensis]